MKRFRDIFPNTTVKMMFMTGMLLVSAVVMAQEQETGVKIHGNVYGGGNLGDVGTHTAPDPASVGNYTWTNNTGLSTVNMTSDLAEVQGNVFGGGKGEATSFECEKGMVYQTNVDISKGTVKGNVYGGGEVSRVERNTVVTIGATGTEPKIEGSVFGAGAGIETHGYSALVRGTSTVTVQGSAQVWHNVYGGGEKASVGKYKVKTPANAETDPDVPATLPYGMPARLMEGGTSTVNILGSAVIGKDDIENSGHVYGAGKGLEPQDYDYVTAENYTGEGAYKENEHKPKRMISGNTWEYFANIAAYLQFVETLALSGETHVTIGGTWTPNETTGTITPSEGTPTIKGSLFGGSENGFVYKNTYVNILDGTIQRNAFGGGRGLESFAEAGRVRWNTNVTISGGAVQGNVYGGGNLGDVGTIYKPADYNYVWRNTAANGNANDTDHGNTAHHNTSATATNTGVCTVTISGGTIGVDVNSTAKHASGHVFGAGKGSETTWWCEKAMAFATNVSISQASGSTTVVYGNVYGGGQVGRVEDDAKVVIGTENATGEAAPDIKGSVFGAGAGVETHGYSALVRGNSDVTVQGTAQVGGSVYGGGEIASVGRFTVVGGLPKHPDSGGFCTVTIQDNAKIGTSGTTHHVFGACKGVDPTTVSERKSMQLFSNRPKNADGSYKPVGNGWNYYYKDENQTIIDDRFVWVNYTEDNYPAFLKTLALTSHPHVTISENATVYGSVYGGGERGLALGDVDVDITGGTIEQDVYGGGALADTNCGNWDADSYTEVTGLTAGASLTGLYTKTVVDGKDIYTEIEDENATYTTGTYYSKGKWHDTAQMTALYTTTVNLTGGLVKGDAYGGGLGQKTGFNGATKNIEATVWGDIAVTLNGTAFDINYYEDTGYTDVVKSGRVFGCNNLLGSPQGDVTVTVWKTVSLDAEGQEKDKPTKNNTTYELAAVYGGGNLASYEAEGKKTNVIIHGCSDTSILTVYGGGNAAAVPETQVDVYSCYEIGALFGGGNGKDKYKNDSGWQTNPGANVNGNANTMIYGGTVHEAYGGSNEKGTITGDVAIDVGKNATGETCPLDVGKLVGAGKNADVNGNLKLVMGCKPTETIPLVFGGADNANVNGDVELTITSGNFTKVFGGNNNGGSIKGHIILNIEETTCIPIKIDHLYLCGNNAAYSQYGYYVKTTKTGGTPIGDPSETADLKDGKIQLIPRESATDTHLAVKSYSYDESGIPSWTVYSGEGNDKCEYDAPVLNVISCTQIGEVFGGGWGTGATVYGNPMVNINMIPGAHADQIDRDGNGLADGNTDALGEIGDVYGGGDAAAVYGNTTVNIGTATSVPVYVFDNDNTNGEYVLQYDGETPRTITETVTGAYITGNVYGGGKLADVGKYHVEEDTQVSGRMNNVIDITGNTNVNICAKYNTTSGKWESVAEGTSGVFIGGSVYGGGKGANTTDATEIDFYCADAMVLGNKDNANGGTFVRIGNGTIGNGTTGGNVYGGGEISRVEQNTAVWIGFGEGVATGTPTSVPDIKGSVFGAGAGLRTHGYSALVRGHSSVTIEGNAKIEQSVYGGGEMATVGRYNVVNNVAESNISGGECTVAIGGYSEIGPDDMVMKNTTTGKPDDYGHVFGAGKGIQPYEGFEDSEQPWSKIPNVYDEETHELVTNRTTYTKFSEIGNKLPKDYAAYIRTLALATKTNVTIKDHAFVKGSVYGGSENGFVQEDTKVTIQDDCQIGNGYVQMTDNGTYLAAANMYSLNRRYTDAEWSAKHLIKDGETNYASSLPECASWPYGQAANAADRYAPYDKDANTTDDLGKYANGNSTEGGRAVGDDGHTFFGNVFGGGSGYYPYKPGRWFEDAGAVYGNTVVDIKGGHILTNVYGGNEMTDVGKYELDNDGKPTTKITSGGKCTITMSGGTIGVPRTLKQIDAHPVTCFLFGAGKGDQRVFFNKSTNVGDVEVNITGGTIYGSVYGGGEDGHVMRDVKLAIGADGVGNASPTGPTIGTFGTSGEDGNVFGGGRGFAGNAYTAGNVAGSVKMDIKGGSMLGSVYGGGQVASVGYGLFESTNTTNYGAMQADNKNDEGETTDYYTDGAVGLGRGHIDITISGGTIGNDLEYIIPKTGSGGNTPSGISETDFTKWTAAQWTTWKEHNNIPKTEFDTTTGRVSHTKGGNVFAGGMGRMYELGSTTTAISSVDWWKLGCAKSTKVTISEDAEIKSTVFGGGELGQVVGYHTATDAADENINVGTEVIIEGGTVGSEIKESNVTRFIYGSVFGGGYGSLVEKLTPTGKDDSYPKYIAGRVKAGTKVEMTAGVVRASVYGGGKMAAVGESVMLDETLTNGHTGDTHVIISGGTIGKSGFGGAKVGNVFGGGSGHNNTVRSGHIYGNTNVTIKAGSVSGEPKIYHNVYGGGAYGSVGDFTYTLGSDSKVNGISGLHEDRIDTSSGEIKSGVAKVTITGGTIGYNGMENGMVFGSSRGDINEPGQRDDYTAWVYDTYVTIGTSGSQTGPQINGSVYGSGENGHTYNDTDVKVYSGTIGIYKNSDAYYTVTSNGKTYNGAEYPYRGNVYGGGCGTDTYLEKYDSDKDGDIDDDDNSREAFNPLAGIVYGKTNVTISGGTVVHNVYGAGAMGSVGKTTWTTTTTTTTIEDKEVTTTKKTSATTTGGSTTVKITGGTIGVNGSATVGDGNVFGAARGSKAIVQTDRDDLARVSVTNVTVSGGEVKGNVYGGGELGDVGTIVKNTSDYNYTWMKSDNSGANATLNNDPSSSTHDTSKNTGICNVTITGGTIGSSTVGGNVFGGGKGDANTWWCEKAMAFATNVKISEASGATTKVYGTVYGGGEIGRVEDDSKVIIGTENGSDTPEILGSVFGAGKGLATRGYSALVRGNSVVTIQGSAQVGGNVFGGGEEASLGRFELVNGLPKSPLTGGSATVTIQDNANIGSDGTDNDVYGAGKGVDPATITAENRKSMQLVGYKPSGDEHDTWDYYIDDDNKKDERFIWVYYKTESAYQAFLNTLAIASKPTVTIAENAIVYGDVYGGGQRGITLGAVAVNITGGTVKQDVYGGGSLADTNKGNWDDDRYVEATVTAGASVAGLYTITGTDDKGNPIYTATDEDDEADGNETYYRKGTWAEGKSAATYTTNVTLTGGEIDRNVYGGGLGQLAKAAVGTSGQEGYVPAVSAVEAKVYGNVQVKLNNTGTEIPPAEEGGTSTYDYCEVKGKIFGCNNLNGSPQNDVTVHVWKTVTKSISEGNVVVNNKPTKDTDLYELEAVYGGGNLAAYYPDDVDSRATAKANVIIDGCELTSIKSVYGGGNAASVPATEVTVNGTYEIGEAFGGGNGKDNYQLDGIWYKNPGANVGLKNYTHWNTASVSSPGTENNPYYLAENNTDTSTREDRSNNYGYGTGKAYIAIYGGTVHKVYGGSNTKGNVRVESHTKLEERGECDFTVDEAYGGGNNAPQDGNAVLEAGCIQGLDIAYGGASEADVNGDVILNITNGTYGRVFGGNNLGGIIRGTITVNIEETGCRPIIIGQLYGGGNLAPYSVENIDKSRADLNFSDPTADNYYKKFPKVNVKSFTSIGTIFGGGYGAPATMVGNPQVNVNVYEGKYYETFKGSDNVINDTAKVVGTSVKYPSDNDEGYATGYPVPSHAKGAIGAINDVFGGGNQAKVIGNPQVNIGTEAGEEVYVEMTVAVGGDVAGYCTRTGTAGSYTYSEPLPEGSKAEEGTIYCLKTTKRVDIRGNVFGGGNNAEVEGDTNVVIGKKKE